MSPKWGGLIALRHTRAAMGRMTKRVGNWLALERECVPGRGAIRRRSCLWAGPGYGYGHGRHDGQFVRDFLSERFRETCQPMLYTDSTAAEERLEDIDQDARNAWTQS